MKSAGKIRSNHCQPITVILSKKGEKRERERTQSGELSVRNLALLLIDLSGLTSQRGNRVAACSRGCIAGGPNAITEGNRIEFSSGILNERAELHAPVRARFIAHAEANKACRERTACVRCELRKLLACIIDGIDRKVGQRVGSGKKSRADQFTEQGTPRNVQIARRPFTAGHTLFGR